MSPENDGAPAASLPTPVGRRWVNYLIGFSVGVGSGLSVYLGKVHVPLFSPLLDLIPFTLQNTLIPLSSALMGIVAVAVQFYSYTRWGARRLGGLFARTIAAVEWPASGSCHPQVSAEMEQRACPMSLKRTFPVVNFAVC